MSTPGASLNGTKAQFEQQSKPLVSWFQVFPCSREDKRMSPIRERSISEHPVRVRLRGSQLRSLLALSPGALLSDDESDKQTGTYHSNRNTPEK